MPSAAALYARISSDKAGDGLGVARQEKLCRDLAARKGWSIAEVYVDNDRSAYSGAERPAYGRMLAAIEAGTVDAVVCVDLDRLTRRPSELERFMELADRHGVALANVSGDTDLSSSDGRLKARILGAVARQESERKSERLKRWSDQRAAAGKPNGGPRAFGYEADRVTVRDDEADLIREACARVLAGETVHGIAVDWNRRGVRPVHRRDWITSSLSTLLRSPRIAGLRVHRGEIIGDAAWPPIVDRATWEQVTARLKANRSPRGPGRPAKRLLVGIARCGKCDGPLWTATRTAADTGGSRYACVSGPGRDGCGGITVSADAVDELVRGAVLAALSGPALTAARRRAAGDDRRQTKAADDLADAERRLDELAGDWADGTLTRREWLTARSRLTDRIEEARRVLDANGHGMLAEVPADADALAAAWDAGDVEWRRALIGTVVDRVVVKPAAKAGPRFDPDRVEITWKA